MANVPVRIIGLDPGQRRTGWGVIASDGARLRWVARQFGEQLGALRIGAPLAVHDVLEFRVAGHGIVFCAF